MTVIEKIKIHQVKPRGFYSQVEIAAAHVEVDNEVLFLQRSGSERGLWGVPGGKIEKGESPDLAVKRELFEETGISLNQDSRIDFLGKLFMSKPDVDYVYHMYRVNFSEKPTVTLSDEHIESEWFNASQVPSLPLMSGALEAFDFYQKWSENKARNGTNVNAYLILKKDDQVLLHLRRNTGYYDGFYGLVSGHIEDGESAMEGLKREAYEESGIHIHDSDLHFVHCLHRQTNRLNIDLFFECSRWSGEIRNREPGKCEELKFFPYHSLPHTTIEYVADVIKCITKGQPYSELGWGALE